MTARWTWHGGGVSAASAHFGGAPETWLDLSTGINPHAWEGANHVAIDWRNLPDERGLAMLEAAAAAHFGVDPDRLCAVPGTEVGLRMIGAMVDGPVRHAVPSYRTHGEMVDGSRPVDQSRLADADGATLILANPNNPDGIVHDPDSLLALLDQRGNGWLIVDEAFVDAVPAASLASRVDDDRRITLFRSFGKYFGLAGVRLGFVIGPRVIIGRLRERLGAWPVSAAAIAIGTAAYRDGDWIAAMQDRLLAEAALLDAMLLRHGYRATGDCPLFRLIDGIDAHALFERLAQQAILTRPFDARPDWLRLGLPADQAACDRLEAALQHG